MISTDSRNNPHLETALQRVRTAVEQAAERCAEGLGLSALSAGMIKRRDALLLTQTLFRQQQALFTQSFARSLRERTDAGKAERRAALLRADWSELSLMDDEQVDALVVSERIGLAIGHQSEWELREVESYEVGLHLGERHPLRPEAMGQALLSAVHAISEEADVRQILIDELTRALALEMRACYADIASLFRSRGLRPQDLRVRAVEAAGLAASRAQPLNSVSGAASHGPGTNSQFSHSGQGGQEAGLPGFTPRSNHQGGIDPQLMNLLRRLAHAAQPALAGGETPASQDSCGHSSGVPSPTDFGASSQAAALPGNLIIQHRDELREAATGRLDHMVIDVIGGLFDQILSDPKVPPQMARLLGRLQLPVLRAALVDATFFSQRRHPVRLFINRMASLACAFDDFREDPGLAFLGQVRALVEELVSGDFERMDVFESKLAALEQFSAQQISQALQAQGQLTERLARHELDLQLQQRYAKQLASRLQPVALPDFLRDFLCQVWSQAVMRAARDLGGAPERAQRFQKLGRELVISVQPKGRSAERQVFLSQLPGLMNTLTEGLDLISPPEAARKQFFAALLPAHAESLKGQSPSALEANLLGRQLDQVFFAPLPTELDLGREEAELPPELDPAEGFSQAEVQDMGLLQEASVDWHGQLDIDLSAEANLQAVDISFDGLPAATEAPEPNQGGLLLEHLHVGFSYQMQSDNAGQAQWLKVRLAHVSEGRSFFIFTHGAKHQQTVTMTARMLKRLCEAKRLRAFENAYLLERAMARTRKQLAAIGAKS